MAVPHSENDLRIRLKEQINLLEKSAKEYDNGDTTEALNLALRMRVLLHDTNVSTSLLKHLDVKDKLEFYDTSLDINPRNKLSTSGLTIFEMSGSGVKYCAPLDDLSPPRKGKKTKFDQWWNKKVIRDQKGTTFSRGELVSKVCNEIGGAHIDRNGMSAKFADLIKYNSMGWKQGSISDGTSVDLTGIEHASIRQIAHEALKTIKEQCTDLLS